MSDERETALMAFFKESLSLSALSVRWKNEAEPLETVCLTNSLQCTCPTYTVCQTVARMAISSCANNPSLMKGPWPNRTFIDHNRRIILINCSEI